MDRIASLLHAIQCQENHPNQMEMIRTHAGTSGLCFFYLEESLDNPWNEPAHRLWLEEAKQFCSSVSKNPPDAIQILIKALHVIRALHKAEELTPGTIVAFKILSGWE